MRKIPAPGVILRSTSRTADTVEIRMFRGTLKLNTLKATLQMVNHLVEVAVSMSDTAVQEHELV